MIIFSLTAKCYSIGQKEFQDLKDEVGVLSQHVFNNDGLRKMQDVVDSLDESTKTHDDEIEVLSLSKIK